MRAKIIEYKRIMDDNAGDQHVYITHRIANMVVRVSDCDALYYAHKFHKGYDVRDFEQAVGWQLVKTMGCGYT